MLASRSFLRLTSADARSRIAVLVATLLGPAFEYTTFPQKPPFTSLRAHSLTLIRAAYAQDVNRLAHSSASIRTAGTASRKKQSTSLASAFGRQQTPGLVAAARLGLGSCHPWHTRAPYPLRPWLPCSFGSGCKGEYHNSQLYVAYPF